MDLSCYNGWCCDFCSPSVDRIRFESFRFVVVKAPLWKLCVPTRELDDGLMIILWLRPDVEPGAQPLVTVDGAKCCEI